MYRKHRRLKADRRKGYLEQRRSEMTSTMSDGELNAGCCDLEAHQVRASLPHSPPSANVASSAALHFSWPSCLLRHRPGMSSCHRNKALLLLFSCSLLSFPRLFLSFIINVSALRYMMCSGRGMCFLLTKLVPSFPALIHPSV